MSAAKTRAQKKGLEGKTRFYQLADTQGNEVQKLLTQKKYLESRSLSAALEKLFLIPYTLVRLPGGLERLKKLTKTWRLQQKNTIFRCA